MPMHLFATASKIPLAARPRWKEADWIAHDVLRGERREARDSKNLTGDEELTREYVRECSRDGLNNKPQ